MMKQPVSKTLKETNTVFVDNGDDFLSEIYNADKPPIGLIYTDNDEIEDGIQPSRGAATLFKMMNDEYSNTLKFVGFKYKNFFKDIPESEVPDFFWDKYAIKKIPSFLFHDIENGKIKRIERASSGMIKPEQIRNYWNIVSSFMDKHYK